MTLFLKLLPLLAGLLMMGCTNRNDGVEEPFLLRAGTLSVTESEFNRALEIEKNAYSHNVLRKPEVMKQVRLRLLTQMAEELVIRKAAHENGIAVSDQELKEKVDEIKADYPDDTFREVMLENAVDYKVWEEGLKKRLLMEKVVRQLLAPEIVITPDEIADYYEKTYKPALSGNGPEDNFDKASARLVERLRSEKIGARYQAWIEKIKVDYSIEVNEELWEKILKGQNG